MPKPYVICHMTSSVDGRVKIARWSRVDVEGVVETAYERVHESFTADAWICGRITMSGYATGAPPQPYHGPAIAREDFIAAKSGAKRYAIGLDPRGRLNWGERNEITGDHIVVVLNEDVGDAHLMALRHAGVSYIFAGRDQLDIPFLLAKLAATFGIQRLLLEGGGRINGSFLSAGAIDELSLLVAPVVDGLIGAPAVFDYSGAADDRTPKGVALTLRSCEKLDGGVVWLRYDIGKTD